MVSPGPSVREKGRKHRKKYGRPGQPTDLREGVANAYIVIREVSGYHILNNMDIFRNSFSV